MMMIAPLNAIQPMTSWVIAVEPAGALAQGAHEHADDRATARVASSSSGPATSTPGKRHSPMSNRSGTSDSQAATVAEGQPARQRVLGAPAPGAPPRHHEATRVASVADAATSHVATSTTSGPGCCAPAAWPTAVTAISAAVVHHTSSWAGRRRPADGELPRHERGEHAGGDRAAPPPRARDALPRGDVVGRGDVAAGLRRQRDGDGDRAADEQAGAEAAVPDRGRPAWRPTTASTMPTTQPGDEPPVLVRRVRRRRWRCAGRRRRPRRRSRRARPLTASARSSTDRRRSPQARCRSSHPPCRGYDGWSPGRIGTPVPICARPEIGTRRPPT